MSPALGWTRSRQILPTSPPVRGCPWPRISSLDKSIYPLDCVTPDALPIARTLLETCGIRASIPSKVHLCPSLGAKRSKPSIGLPNTDFKLAHADHERTRICVLAM